MRLNSYWGRFSVAEGKTSVASKCSGSEVQSSPGSFLVLLALPGDTRRQVTLLDTPSPSTLPRLVHEGLQHPPLGLELRLALAGRSQSPGVDFPLGLLRVGVPGL